MKRNRLLLMEMLKNSNKTGKVFLLLAAVAMCFCMTNEAMAQEVASGETGDCTWTLTGTSGNYTLTISGTGAMGNYTYNSSPWYLYRTGIKTVDIQQGVTSIGNYAFYYCENLTSLTVSESVASIGNYAFYYCPSLISISIGNSVTSIGNYALYYCRSLTSLTIPESVANIGTRVFLGCSSLTAIDVHENNAVYASENGILFNKEKTTLIQCPQGKQDENYTVPNSVISIENWAFAYCSLRSVTIGNSVTGIGDYAFYYCPGPVSITVGNSVTGIGNFAFIGCERLNSLTVPASVTSIGEGAFSFCSSLTAIDVHENNVAYASENGVLFNKAKTVLIQYPAGKPDINYTIPNSVTGIEYRAFSRCSNLASVIISNNVTNIGYGAFIDCMSLVAFDVLENNAVYASENGVLFNRAKTSLVLYPQGKPGNYTIPNSVTGIDDGAFEDCRLTAITVPGSVTSFGYRAFYCYNLSVVTMLNPTPPAIDDFSYVFDDYLISYATLYVPAGSVEDYKAAPVWRDFGTVTEIRTESGMCGDNLTWTLSNGTLTISGTGEMRDYYYDSAPWSDFRNSIGTVIIENEAGSIGDYAFSECYGLSSVTVGNSVTSIGFGAFSYCYSLAAIDVLENNAVYASENGVLFDKAKTILFQYPRGKPNTDYIIPGSVIIIGYPAFSACENLRSITIPNSVTDIENYAFSDCWNLTSITIPESVIYIGNYAFQYCSSLTAINVLENNTAYASENGILFDKAKTTLIQYPAKKLDTDYTIPNSVTSIGNSAFAQCWNLVSLTIPNSVTNIGYDAFYNCRNLTSVTIPESVISIGNYAFHYCENLISVTIPASVASIGYHAFFSCSNLRAIDVHENNAAYASENGVLFNKEKTSLIQYPEGKPDINYTIPNSVTGIENYAFYSCENLTLITIPESVTSIGDDAFSLCGNLTSVTIPNSVTSIGTWVFNYCRNLTSVTILGSVTSIGNYAFRYCWNLTSFTNLNPEPQAISSYVFEDVTLSNATLYVPAGSVETYKAADIWKNFGTVTAVQDQEEKCGENLTWTFSNGTLTISGTGDMWNFSSNNPVPWSAYQTSIKTAIIEDGATSIGNQAFFSCTELSSVTIPGSVTVIGSETFQNCRNLTSITLPHSLSTIRRAAFLNTGLTSITIPAAVTAIGTEVFSDCLELKSILVDADNVAYSSDGGVLYNKNKDFLHSYPGGRSGSFVIPDFVTTIGSYAFNSCSKLSSVTIPASVTGIGHAAFQCCSSLTSVTIPGSVTSIGSGVFIHCSMLTAIHVDDGKTVYASMDGLLYNKNKDLLHTCPAGRSGDLVIPASVTTIEYGAFWGCRLLTSVTIPASVTGMGGRLFIDCYTLKDITVEWSDPLPIDEFVFDAVNIAGMTLHVPEGTKAIYEAANVWKDFGTITEYVPVAIDASAVVNAVRVYPDLATESFRIIGLTAPTQVTVADISGKTVLQQTVKGDESISVGHLPQGIYLVRVNERTVKVIKSF